MKNGQEEGGASEIEIPPIPIYRDEEGYLRIQGGLHRIKAAAEIGSTMLRKLRFEEIGMARDTDKAAAVDILWEDDEGNEHVEKIAVGDTKEVGSHLTWLHTVKEITVRHTGA